MALHVSGKLFAVGVVIATLITAFSAPRNQNLVDLIIAPQVHVLPAINVSIEPSVAIKEIQMPVVAADAPTSGPAASLTFTVKATGYNSHASQTDSTPDITALGTQTRFGIIAVSRDLLGKDVPYGSLVRLKDLGNYYNGRNSGKYQALLDSQGLFIVEDTMHARKTMQIDVWFPHLSDALNWGVRQVGLEVVRYGYDGPTLYSEADTSQFSAQQ